MSIKISGKSFYPGTIQFDVLAKDFANNLSGKATLTVLIIPDNPVIILTPASGSVSTNKDLLLNASQSYDPDGIFNLTFM